LTASQIFFEFLEFGIPIPEIWNSEFQIANSMEFQIPWNLKLERSGYNNNLCCFREAVRKHGTNVYYSLAKTDIKIGIWNSDFNIFLEIWIDICYLEPNH
jgi:hypothetical protein